MSKQPAIQFIDNPAISERASAYKQVEVNVPKVLKSWQKSLFSFEWLKPDGTIKSIEELAEKDKPKRQDVESQIAKNAPIAKPILGIGIMDNVEIGIGRAEFLTLAAHGLKTMPVHIPQSNEPDFKSFIAKEDT